VNAYRWLIVAFWLVFVVYWALAAIDAKRGVRAAWSKEIGLRFVLVVLIGVAVRFAPLRHALHNLQVDLARNALVPITGVVLCALGLGLAMLARAQLGPNWGMPMSRRDNPELVVTGPYARVRHPIYAGILLAMLGSTLGLTIFFVIPLVLFGSYFVYSAKREEQMLQAQFPQRYASYMQRTGMLLPHVFRAPRDTNRR
jgi:protein-S-isoprenylcysteine O-methyltransferase Ste14